MQTDTTHLLKPVLVLEVNEGVQQEPCGQNHCEHQEHRNKVVHKLATRSIYRVYGIVNLCVRV